MQIIRENWSDFNKWTKKKNNVFDVEIALTWQYSTSNWRLAQMFQLKSRSINQTHYLHLVSCFYLFFFFQWWDYKYCVDTVIDSFAVTHGKQKIRIFLIVSVTETRFILFNHYGISFFFSLVFCLFFSFFFSLFWLVIEIILLSACVYYI